MEPDDSQALKASNDIDLLELFFTAIRSNKPNTVEFMISENASLLNMMNENLQTGLHIAVRAN